MLKKLLTAALLLLAAPSYAAVTIPDAPTVDASTDARTDPEVAHTVTADTTLLLVCMAGRGGAGYSIGGITAAGGSMAEIYDSEERNSFENADVQIWGMVSPDAGATTVAINVSGTMAWDIIAIINVKGTVVSSLGAAAVFVSDDLNNENGTGGATSNTSVHASGGNAGNALLFCGSAIGSDMDGGTNNAGFDTIVAADSGGVSGGASEGSIEVSWLNSAPSAITHTWAATDDNASALIELVAAAAPSGAAVKRRRR